MSKLTSSSGDILTMTAPSGGVVSGVPKLIGLRIVIPVADAAAGEQFAGVTRGYFGNLPANAAADWSDGDLLYWNETADEVTDISATGLCIIGTAVGDKAASATTCGVYVDGASRALQA